MLILQRQQKPEAASQWLLSSGLMSVQQREVCLLTSMRALSDACSIHANAWGAFNTNSCEAQTSALYPATDVLLRIDAHQ